MVKKEQLYDVVLYRFDDLVVREIVGKDMRYDEGFHNACKRQMTVIMRCNEQYSASIVKAGTMKVGDKLPQPRAKKERAK